jgi:hypothetical protein
MLTNNKTQKLPLLWILVAVADTESVVPVITRDNLITTLITGYTHHGGGSCRCLVIYCRAARPHPSAAAAAAAAACFWS